MLRERITQEKINLVRRYVRRNGGSSYRTARQLGMSCSTIYRIVEANYDLAQYKKITTEAMKPYNKPRVTKVVDPQQIAKIKLVKRLFRKPYIEVTYSNGMVVEAYDKIWLNK